VLDLSPHDADLKHARRLRHQIARLEHTDPAGPDQAITRAQISRHRSATGCHADHRKPTRIGPGHLDSQEGEHLAPARSLAVLRDLGPHRGIELQHGTMQSARHRRRSGSFRCDRDLHVTPKCGVRRAIGAATKIFLKGANELHR
jgi:hypothetical protein